MINRDDGFRLLTGEPVGSTEKERSPDRDAELLAGLWQRRAQYRTEFNVEMPEYLPPDQRTLLGGKKESALVQQHNNQITATYSAAILAEFALKWGLKLEVVGVFESARTLSAIAGVLHSLPANSFELTSETEQVLDSAGRVRELVTAASESYRRRAFG